MTAPSNDQARRDGGWYRRRQDRAAAEAQWLDDGGAAGGEATAGRSVTSAEESAPPVSLPGETARVGAPGITMLAADEAIAVGEHRSGSGTALKSTGRAP